MQAKPSWVQLVQKLLKFPRLGTALVVVTT